MSSSSAGRGVIGLGPLPEWIRVGVPSGHYPEVQSTLQELGLATVCREARCPNKSECWSAGTATLMLLGTDCTRRCAFCAVRTHWSNGAFDPTEPARVAEGVRRWGLRYVVLTQVCRDDLPDGGASILGETVRRLREAAPQTLVELLVGDLGGDERALATLLESPPDVLAHNLETTRRLTPTARDHRAGYDRSLELLRRAREIGPDRLVTKSSVMLGLGESREELAESFRDLRANDVDLLTLGQYLRPSPAHLPVDRYLPPSEFAALADAARAAGFAGVEAGPLVRSSYHAEELYRSAIQAPGSVGMAKKARKKLEEDEEARSFEFPEFDETKFIEHEQEQTIATGLALGLAVLLGFVSFALDRTLGTSGAAVYVPVGVGLIAVVSSPFIFLRLRPSSEDYTKGDWASLILLQVFGWLGIWFLLTDIFLGA